MSNIFLNKKQKHVYNKSCSDIEVFNRPNNIRHYPPANKEWIDSVYSYDKNFTKLLPSYNKLATKYTKSYFNLYNPNKLEKLRSKRFRIRLKRLSINRIFISKAEVKHSNAKVSLTVFIHNGQLNLIKNEVKKNLLHFQRYNKNSNFNNKIRKNEKNLKLNANKLFLFKLKMVKYQLLKINRQINREKQIFSKTFNPDYLNIKTYENIFYKRFVRKFLKKEKLIVNYKRLHTLNLFKLTNILVLPLHNMLKKIYNKQIEFNLINIKHPYLNSDLFTQVIVTKLRNRKMRLLRVMKQSLNTVKVPVISPNYYDTISNKNLISMRYLKDGNESVDLLDKLLKNIFPFFGLEKDRSVQTAVLCNTKHKMVNGARIEGSGRLTKRFTAARSVFKYRYKGSLKNIDSSYRNLSSVMVRNNNKSNLQFTKKAHKTRIGSFGIKGWISSS